MALTQEQLKKFWEDGYLLLDNFITDTEADKLRTECHDLVSEMNPADHNTVFTTLDMKRTSDDYFLNSGDKIRFFFEDGSRDEQGNLKVDKQLSLNKIGHALHVFCPSFKKVTFDDKIKGIAKSLNLVEPVVCQSMYIFKQPGIGGEVTPHQDLTFLYTDPMKLFGYWIALEDAEPENGCLYFYPGSHKRRKTAHKIHTILNKTKLSGTERIKTMDTKRGGIYGNRRMIRNPDLSEGQSRCTFRGDVEKFDDDKFVPVPVKKGGLVLIHGEVVHKSAKNTSNRSRHIYTFHLFDKKDTEYSKENWLQQTDEVPFTPLYTTAPV